MDWVAAYAAVVGTAALGWEVWKAVQARRLKVEVDLANAMLAYPAREPAWSAQIQVRNHGDHQINVTSAGLYTQDGTDQRVVMIRQQPGATLPGVVGPHDSGFTYFLEDELQNAGLDWFRPLVAWAALSTGERVNSKPPPCDGRSARPLHACRALAGCAEERPGRFDDDAAEVPTDRFGDLPDPGLLHRVGLPVGQLEQRLSEPLHEYLG
jgi:hypothetical protein